MNRSSRLFAILFAASIFAIGSIVVASDTSALMGMEIPAPGDAGPTWATNLQEALEIVDAHDHSAGKGTKVTPAGINVNVDLEMNLQDLTEVRTVRFDSTAVTIAGTDRRALYNIGGELAYIDEAGNITTITNNGSVNGVAGSIDGMGSTTADVTYSDATDTFSFTSNTGFPAKGDFSTVRIAEHVAAGKGPILTSNAATAADYNWIFPAALPAANRLLCLDAAGDLTTCTASAAAEALVVATSTSSGTMSATSTIVAGTTVRALTGAFGLASQTGGDTQSIDGAANSTTTPSTVATFPGLTASGAYFVTCRFQVSSAADTTGVQIGLDFSPAPSSAQYDCGSWSDASVWTYQATTGDDSRCAMTSTVAGAESSYTLSGWFENSAATTSMDVRLRSEVGTSLATIHAGICTVVPANP